MTTLVETVARAMATAEGFDPASERTVRVYAPMAIAALKAMQEPTDAMFNAGCKARTPNATIGENTLWTWRAMIDAAIQEHSNLTRQSS